MMHVRRMWRIRKFAGRIKIIWIFLEEERRIAIRVVAHLYRVSGIVATNAIDSSYREERVSSGDGESHNRWQFDHELRHPNLRIPINRLIHITRRSEQINRNQYKNPYIILLQIAIDRPKLWILRPNWSTNVWIHRCADETGDDGEGTRDSSASDLHRGWILFARRPPPTRASTDWRTWVEPHVTPPSFGRPRAGRFHMAPRGKGYICRRAWWIWWSRKLTGAGPATNAGADGARPALHRTGDSPRSGHKRLWRGDYPHETGQGSRGRCI